MVQKTPFVINDILFLEEFCNLACGYCEGFYPTEFKFKPREGKLRMPTSWKAMVEADQSLQTRLSSEPTVDSLFDVGREVLERMNEKATYPILKLSGGEIFLYDKLVSFVESIHDQYSGVQLLTNGVLFGAAEVDRLASLGNVYFQISLDGVTPQTNSSRSKSGATLDRILRNIDRIQDAGMGLEINCVLTNTNTDSFLHLAEYMAHRGTSIVMPRPVRGPPAKTQAASDEQVRAFATVRERYNDIGHVLPPEAYLDRVISVLERKQRSWDCFVPFFVLGENYYGKINTCTCSGALPVLGNALDKDTTAFHTLSTRAQYDAKSKPEPCADCITQYEVFNLYAEGKVTDAELTKLATFRVPNALATAQRIKAELHTSR